MHGKGRAGGGAIPLTIHIANFGKTDAAGTHARALARFLSALCAAAACTFILFPVPLFPLDPAYSLPEKAQASSVWPLPSPRLSVDLGFLERYEFSGATYTHRGVDIEADAGACISSPVDGTVSFVGEVPAGDAGANGGSGGDGATMRAVSVKMDDGRSVTLMPVQDSLVQEGAHVMAGQELGRLAASGDRSSASPHLHMGLKRGSSYYDPLSLFGLEGMSSASAAVRVDDAVSGAAAAAASGAEAGASAEANMVDAAAPISTGAAAESARASQGIEAVRGADAAQSSEAYGQAQEGAAAEAAAGEAFGTISSGDAAVQPAAQQQGASPLDGVRAFLASALEAPLQQLDGLCQALAASAAAPWLAVAAGVVGAAGVAGLAGARRLAGKKADEGRAGEKQASRRPRLSKLRTGAGGVVVWGHNAFTAATSAAIARLRGIRAACAPKNVFSHAFSQRRKIPPCEGESGVVG